MFLFLFFELFLVISG
jgi:hypothetical protein